MSTSLFQVYPDYFDSIEDCNEFNKNYNKKQSNSRYKNFRQINFTAGDYEQFNKYKCCENGNEKDIIINNTNLFYEYKLFNEWEKYKNLNASDINNTFKYIFEKFKKGIYIKIMNNDLKTFLPFSNTNFINEWSHKIKIDPSKYGSFDDFFKYIVESDGYKFNKNHINKYVNTWYSNNCLLRYEYPINEGDTNVSTIKNMLEELCKYRQVPDIEFFINRRDFPILTKNGFEPYYDIWDSKEYPLVSHNYDKYIPVLSMSSSDEFADILSPTYEDWVRVQSKENKWFPKSRQTYKDDMFNIPWEEKKITAVFRGSSTGEGIDIKTNQRLHLAYLSSITEPDENGIPYIDAGITKWNIRAKKLMGERYLNFIDKTNTPFNLVNTLTPLEQSSYKYIIHVDGHVSAFRLSYELSLNSVILIVESKWKTWFSNLLKPYEHYVPIKEDLSDLIEKIKWCRLHDEECKKIAFNAKKLYDTYLQKDGILDYYQKLLIDVKKEVGIYFYNRINNIDIIIQDETKYLFSKELIYPKNGKKIEDIDVFPKSKRCYGKLKAIEWVINMINKESEFEKIVEHKEDIFSNKLGVVKKFELNNFSFAVKSTNDYFKSKEHIHEAYIGINGINEILKDIPNFSYIFGIYKKEDGINIITEYISELTLQKYIMSENFNFYEFLNIILQLCLALQVAQQRFCFVHYDLTPWNIVLKYLKEPSNIHYIINGKVIRIRAHIIPVIIDYGKSHIIYNNTHHGFIKPYNFSSSFDIITLFITTVYQIIISNFLSGNDLSNFLKLTNFISGTKYCPNKFKNIKDAKMFFHKVKKYSNLINDNKHELEGYTPMDLFNYIVEKINYKFQYSYTINHYTSYMNRSDPEQIFEFILSKNNEQRLKSFLDVFNKVKTIDLINIDEYNDISTMYILQKLENNITSVMEDMNYFLEDQKLKNEYEYIFDDSINYLKKLYKKKYKNLLLKDIQNVQNIDILNRIDIGNYNEEIFLFPEKIKKLISKFNLLDEKNIEQLNRYLNIKYILEVILFHDGIFKISIKNKNKFKNVLELNTVNILNKIANICSLKEHVNIIYNNNIEEIEKDKDNCDLNNIINYLNDMKCVIKNLKNF